MPDPFRLAVTTNARRGDQRRVHQRARAHAHPFGRQLARDRLEQRAVQMPRYQLGTETHERGALRRRLVPRIVEP